MSTSKLVSNLEAISKAVEEVITKKLFNDISEANLISIATQATTCSNIIKEHQKSTPSSHLSSAEAALTNEMIAFETLVKGLMTNPHETSLRKQLTHQSYQLIGRFQQVIFAAHEVVQGGPNEATSSLKLDIDPMPTWVSEVDASVEAMPLEGLMKQCEAIGKPQVKLATHPMCVSVIMDFMCADTPEGKDWWITANHEIEVYKAYLSAGEDEGGGGGGRRGPYSSRLAAQSAAAKDKTKYTKEVVEKMDVEAIRQVLETWGLPPGGQTENMQERILGYLNDPFYCDDIIFQENNVVLGSMSEEKNTTDTVSKETAAQEAKLKTILAEVLTNPVAPPCPEFQSAQFTAKTKVNPSPTNGHSNGPSAVGRGPKPTPNHVEVRKVPVRVDPFSVVTVDPFKYSVPPQSKEEFSGFHVQCKRGHVYSKFVVGHSISSSGTNGTEGSRGRDGERGSDGRDADCKGNNGEEGGQGGDATEGGPGSNGTDASPIALSMSYAEGGKVKVEGFESNELSLSPGEIVWVQATGGNGGSGGPGGNGGPGGRGGNGADGTDGQNGKDATSYGLSGDDGSSGSFGGFGGLGGCGGQSGRGGPGGSGGHGGNVTITVTDPKLLVLVEGNSLGGDFGRGGSAGVVGLRGPGGKGGRGGRKGYGGKAFPADAAQPGGVGNDGSDGNDGTDGPDGQDGYEGSFNYDGDDGLYGKDASVTYQVLEGNTVTETSNVKFCPVVQGYTILDENSDGIFEPGSKITVSQIAWENCGGITLPAGAVMMLTVNSKMTDCPAVTLDALPSKGAAVVSGSLWGTLPTVQVPDSGPAKLACEVSTHMHLLEGYPFFGAKLCTIIEVRYPVEIDQLEVPKVVAPGAEYKIKLIKNVSARPIAAGELTFQASTADIGKPQLPFISPFSSSFVELVYKADEQAELYSVIEWSAKLMFKGKHIENASASVRVAPIYNFDRPPQMALLITGANMDLQSFKDLRDMDSMKGLSFNEDNKHRYHWAARYDGKLIVMSLPTPQSLNSLDVGDLIQPLNKNTGVCLLLAAPTHLSEKLFAESPEVEKYSQKEFTGRHAPFFTPSKYDVYGAIQSIRKKHEKKDQWRVVQVKHTVDKQTKLGAMLWSYGECEVRKMPLPKGTRLLNIATLVPLNGSNSPRTSAPSPPTSPPSTPSSLPSSSSTSSVSSSTPPALLDNILSNGAPADINTTTTFSLPSRFVQAFVGTLCVLPPPKKKIEFLVTLPQNGAEANKWTFTHRHRHGREAKHTYTIVDILAETIYYDLKHEFWENDKDKFPATTEYVTLAGKSTGHENSQLVVKVVLGAVYRLNKFTHRSTAAQKKMLKNATEQLDRIASQPTKKHAKAQEGSKIKLGPLLFSFQFPTNGESKVERAERKAKADKLAKKTVFGRAKIGIFGKSK